MARPTEWLKNARKRAGYASQDDLAKAMGVARGAVGNWETGRDRPSMANAERLATLLHRQRSEVLAKFGYPIGGGEPLTELPIALPPEWLDAFRAEVAAGVAEGMAQVVEMLRTEGLLPAVDKPPRRQSQRRSA
ncbi:MAG TPA: helix-turn-helix domain-containing protein [Candidatus Limnocylindrales bacterium]|nr:helix-turn-helix domain-containing protein [Candidatus Limnocylindrales bacterium]